MDIILTRSKTALKSNLVSIGRTVMLLAGRRAALRKKTMCRQAPCHVVTTSVLASAQRFPAILDTSRQGVCVGSMLESFHTVCESEHICVREIILLTVHKSSLTAVFARFECAC